MYEYLKENLDGVISNIKNACNRSGKNFDDITLIGVTKTIDEDTINKSIDFGIKNIGENKVQEITRKYDKINQGVKWHLIGHLQTNKVKYIIDKVSLIHSVDSYKLAEEISKRAVKSDLTMNILIQINVAEEESKFGINKGNIYEMIENISKLPSIKIQGLMNIAPYFEDNELVRKYFREMKEIFDQIKNNNYENVNMKYLSMGMTNDYEIAIEEGATMVRVGTSIFGRR